MHNRLIAVDLHVYMLILYWIINYVPMAIRTWFVAGFWSWYRQKNGLAKKRVRNSRESRTLLNPCAHRYCTQIQTQNIIYSSSSKDDLDHWKSGCGTLIRITMATQSISSSPARQAIFAQEKLERIYLKTYGYLRPYKGAIELAQEVLVWKKPIASALLYIVIHWMFV